MIAGPMQPQRSSAATERAILDTLLHESAIYRSRADYRELLDFVVRLRNFAPFNALLLQIQKPGLLYAASGYDWADRFGRYPKDGARPLLIMWPFGPVALVYDVVDTIGNPLPHDVAAFLASGPDVTTLLGDFAVRLRRRRIDCRWIDAGDANAGSIEVASKDWDGKGSNGYRLRLNQNHSSSVQFVTLAHELAHLFLGHLGGDTRLAVPDRGLLDHSRCELEAESVAYLVSRRNGIHSRSHVYLSRFVESGMTTDQLDLYQIMRAAGQIEAVLGLSRTTKFPKSKRTNSKGLRLAAQRLRNEAGRWGQSF